jgi:hypothetical protein
MDTKRINDEDFKLSHRRRFSLFGYEIRKDSIGISGFLGVRDKSVKTSLLLPRTVVLADLRLWPRTNNKILTQNQTLGRFSVDARLITGFKQRTSPQNSRMLVLSARGNRFEQPRISGIDPGYSARHPRLGKRACTLTQK